MFKGVRTVTQGHDDSERSLLSPNGNTAPRASLYKELSSNSKPEVLNTWTLASGVRGALLWGLVARCR